MTNEVYQYEYRSIYTHESVQMRDALEMNQKDHLYTKKEDQILMEYLYSEMTGKLPINKEIKISELKHKREIYECINQLKRLEKQGMELYLLTVMHKANSKYEQNGQVNSSYIDMALTTKNLDRFIKNCFMPKVFGTQQVDETKYRLFGFTDSVYLPKKLDTSKRKMTSNYELHNHCVMAVTGDLIPGLMNIHGVKNDWNHKFIMQTEITEARPSACVYASKSYNDKYEIYVDGKAY